MAREVNPLWMKIGAELRKHRKGMGVSQDHVARALRVSSSLISYWEGGSRAPQLDQCQQLDELFKTSGVFRRLWNSVHNHGIYPAGSQTAIDFERMAAEVREFHMTLVPGLVQTPEYARAVFRATRPWVDPSTLDRLVESRMKRQEVLESHDRPLLWMVLDEGVIRRVLGDVVTAKAQLDHLLKLVEDSVLRLQVVPWSLKLPPGISGPFRIFIFPDRPMVVSAEHVVDDLVIDDGDQVRGCVTMFGAIQAEALSTSDSVQLVRQVQGELDG
ncbi:helix-turn-helix domain-containing protein [Halostreptopolyspora alba]|uniref:XRE family transcriptional regulator n=1 Tax=Halostreptopolyspora alba TaxID=2487137 RepID=A0A3N0E1D2_9ACTN|nr:XRE family transcriptional regulator [Nocardiopsaceae bacterium YIM 96095]